MHSSSGGQWITRHGIAAALVAASGRRKRSIIASHHPYGVSRGEHPFNVAVSEWGGDRKVMCIQADNAKGCGGIVPAQKLRSRRGNYSGKASAHGCSKVAHRCSRSTHHRGVEARYGHHDDALKHSEQAHASSIAAHGKSTEAHGKSVAAAKK